MDPVSIPMREQYGISVSLSVGHLVNLASSFMGIEKYLLEVQGRMKGQSGCTEDSGTR